MDAWAERPARAGDRCVICTALFEPKDTVYYVTQLDRDTAGNEQPVCGRHVS